MADLQNLLTDVAGLRVGNAEDALRTRRREIDKALQGEIALGDMIEQQRHQRLHPGHARRRVGIDLVFFFPRMRRMVGADHIDHADADSGTITDSTATMPVLRRGRPQASRMA